MATLTMVAAIPPMAFVGGLMGPYMRPIPVGAAAAMLFSLTATSIVTPWAAARLLRATAPTRTDRGGGDQVARLSSPRRSPRAATQKA